MKIGVIKDDRFLEHAPDAYHPENPDRLKAIYQWLDSRNEKDIVYLEPRPASEEEILMVHTKDLYDIVKASEGKSGHFDPDTYYCPASFRTALLAAGSVLSACDAVQNKDVSAAFAFIRPPGHHAEKNRSMGFCLFNNVAIAAMYLKQTYGMKKILIVDWDLHHGNGTQHTFYSDPGVLYFSVHQYPYYPGTGAMNECGEAEGTGFNINIPLPMGMGDADYALAFDRILVPVAQAYRPDFILVSAGFDAHMRDPLGGMAVTDKGFGYMMHVVKEIADASAGGKILLCLEGGYDLNALSDSVAAVYDVLQGKPPVTLSLPSAQTMKIMENAVTVQKQYRDNL